MAKFKDFLKQNENPHAKEINEDIIYTLRREPLCDYIVDAFRTLESKNVKIKSWELITDENKFDTENVNVRYIKNKKNKKYNKRMPIDISRYDLLIINFELTGHDEKTKVLMKENYQIRLNLFKRCKKYYYVIGGNRFYPIYQLVENSTYSTKDYLIEKTLLSSITLKKGNINIVDINGECFYVPVYTLCLFKSKVNPIVVYFATMGVTNTLKYMKLYDIITIDNKMKYDKDEEYCFRSHSGLYVKVIKYFFDNDLFTKNMVYSILEATENCNSIKNLNNIDYWVIELGKRSITSDKNKNMENDKLYSKGKSFIYSFSRLLDDITKKITRTEQFNKLDIYAIIRWMMRNYDALKNKDNMDLKNKRIRMAEYIAGYLVKRLSTRMHKFMAIPNKDITLKDVETLVHVEPDFLVKLILSSKKSLLRKYFIA